MRPVCLSFDYVGVGDGGDFILRPVALDCLNCLPAILRLSGNTRAGYAGRHVVGSRSGLIVSPPASYPMRLRILCPIAPSRLPRAVSSAPFPCLLRPHRPANRPNALPIHYPGTPLAVFPPLPLIAYHAPPAVSVERGVFPKRIEFDAFKTGLRSGSFLAACLPSYGFPLPPRRLISSSHHLIEMRLASPAYRSHPIPSRGRLMNGAVASITPRQSPRLSCRETGRMCLDVIECHAADTIDIR